MAEATFYKTCTACKQSLPATKFGLASGYKDGRRTQCTPCRAARNKLTQTAEQRAAINRRLRDKGTWRFQRHGITKDAFLAILASQGGVCGICGLDKTSGDLSRWHMDHCHRTNSLRGVLCHRCNINLGVLENQEYVRAAGAYLAIHSSD